MPPKVFIIILNYNRPEDTIECVQSVLRSDYPAFTVLLVDNASEDPSHSILSRQFPDLVLLQNGENLGYAGGNNTGIRYALRHGADYVLVLNNDTIVEPDALKILLETGEKIPEATLLAPKVNEYSRRKVINSMGTSMDWFKLRPGRGAYGREDNGGFESITEASIIPGAALLMKRRLFEQVGLFNEDFFLIHEDADLCLRNLKAGFKNVVVPPAVIYHKISKTLCAYPEASEYYSIRNFLSLAKFHARGVDRCKVYAGLILLSLKKVFLYGVVPSGRPEIRAFFAGAGDYFKGRGGPFRPAFQSDKGLDRFQG